MIETLLILAVSLGVSIVCVASVLYGMKKRDEERVESITRLHDELENAIRKTYKQIAQSNAQWQHLYAQQLFKQMQPTPKKTLSEEEILSGVGFDE